MSKKHFIAIAAEFNAQITGLKATSRHVMSPDRVELAVCVVKDSIDAFVRVATQDNPRFNADTFRAACGV